MISKREYDSRFKNEVMALLNQSIQRSLLYIELHGKDARFAFMRPPRNAGGLTLPPRLFTEGWVYAVELIGIASFYMEQVLPLPSVETLFRFYRMDEFLDQILEIDSRNVIYTKAKG